MRGRRIAPGDVLVAVGAAAILLVTGWSGGRSDRQPGAYLGALTPAGLDVAGYALLVAGGLVLALRRRAPVAVLAFTGACAAGYQAVGFDVPAVAYLVAVYAAVRAGHRTAVVVTSLILLAVLPLAAMASGVQDTGAAFAQARGALEVAWLIAAGAAGEALRQAERRAEEAERTREEAERTREETARRRADEERLHIARELHDSLTQQISVITVQAEVAVHLARKRGDEVPETLLAIRDAGREAARELRATLEALRDDGRRVPPGIDHVPDLVHRARTTGLDARLTIEGQRGELPAAVERTAYRIVQESLTNITRHAGAATASVRIDYGPDVLAIRVDDDGTASPGAMPPPGVGLLGMRERVTALGGRLCAEPRREGGFRVQAELPVHPRS